MRKYAPVLIGIACLLWLGGCSSCRRASTETPPPGPSVSASEAAPSLPGGVIDADAVVLSAKVVKIDQKNRLVTLMGPAGNLQTIKADESVKNLSQVKVGDIVVVAYYESVAFQVKKAGTATPGVTIEGAEAVAKPGQKPAGMVQDVVTVTTTLVAIDKLAPSVTLKGPEGDLVVVNVKDPKNLASLQVGDLVQISYTEAVAISVEKPAKK